MSFPGSFASQLSAIMEALLKAVVAEVTGLVEHGAVELRLELRDRDRQILEKEREIEERDRVIEELRAAVEELTAREEAEDTREQSESCRQEWTKEEESEPIVKHESTEDFTTAAADFSESLWIPPPTLPPVATATTACEFDESRTQAKHETTQSYSHHSPETEDFSHYEQDALPLDSLLNLNQERFYSAQPGFSLTPRPARVQESTRNKSARLRSVNVTKQSNSGGFRCDQCGKTFTVKWRLTTHRSVHTGERPYSCRKCGKRFSRRDNCVRHERSHARCNDSPGKG